jgi:NAD+ synthase
MNHLPIIDAKQEEKKIISYIQKVLAEQRIKNIIIGMSGGVDSTTAFHLLRNSINPRNIFVAHLYYFDSLFETIKPSLKKANIPEENIFNLSIKDTVDGIKKITNVSDENKVRLGNIMARIRMTILYDLAKKNNAMVMGTEDKSEFLLGYFTRFGDEASDIEIIRHLYKTQVYKLAEHLEVSEKITSQKPSPGLWIGHTAENELGFSYKEADTILYLYYDKRLTLEEIKKMNFKNAEKVINFSLKNNFKHKVPYLIP